jgi:hypothetical protein
MGPCIFCFRSEPEVTFSREHLIPDCLGGRLILHEYVCAECNSELGAEFDHEILKNPNIITALEKLKVPHDRAQLINRNFRVRGFAEGIEVKGRATGEGFEFPPQPLPNGSLVHPEAEYKEPLLKRTLRNQRLYVAGLTADQIREEFRKLTEAYDQAKVGDKVEWPTLGVTLMKRSDALKIKLEPKGSGDASHLVAKIAYEFGFIVGYRDFLSSERVAQPLHRLIMTGEKQPGFHVFQLSTDFSDFVPVHFISFQIYEYMTRVIVGFFGSIAYTLIAPPFQHKVLHQTGEHYNCHNLIGVEYQQDLQEETVGFWALLPDGNNKYIGP